MVASGRARGCLDESERTGDADFAVALGDLARFRVNLFLDNHGVGSVLRQTRHDSDS